MLTKKPVQPKPNNYLKPNARTRPTNKTLRGTYTKNTSMVGGSKRIGFPVPPTTEFSSPDVLDRKESTVDSGLRWDSPNSPYELSTNSDCYDTPKQRGFSKSFSELSPISTVADPFKPVQEITRTPNELEVALKQLSLVSSTNVALLAHHAERNEYFREKLSSMLPRLLRELSQLDPSLLNSSKENVDPVSNHEPRANSLAALAESLGMDPLSPAAPQHSLGGLDSLNELALSALSPAQNQGDDVALPPMSENSLVTPRDSLSMSTLSPPLQSAQIVDAATLPSRSADIDEINSQQHTTSPEGAGQPTPSVSASPPVPALAARLAKQQLSQQVDHHVNSNESQDHPDNSTSNSSNKRAADTNADAQETARPAKSDTKRQGGGADHRNERVAAGTLIRGGAQAGQRALSRIKEVVEVTTPRGMYSDDSEAHGNHGSSEQQKRRPAAGNDDRSVVYLECIGPSPRDVASPVPLTEYTPRGMSFHDAAPGSFLGTPRSAEDEKGDAIVEVVPASVLEELVAAQPQCRKSRSSRRSDGDDEFEALKKQLLDEREQRKRLQKENDSLLELNQSLRKDLDRSFAVDFEKSSIGLDSKTNSESGSPSALNNTWIEPAVDAGGAFFQEDSFSRGSQKMHKNDNLPVTDQETPDQKLPKKSSVRRFFSKVSRVFRRKSSVSATAPLPTHA